MTTETRMMRAEALQALVIKLSNGCWCRHWLHWNYPTRSPWVMAVECLQSGYDDAGKWGLYPVQAGGMEAEGFVWDDVDKRYYIDRDVVADGVSV